MSEQRPGKKLRTTVSGIHDGNGWEGDDRVSSRVGRCAPARKNPPTAWSSSSALGDQPAMFAGPLDREALDSAATLPRGPAQETSESAETTTPRAAPATAAGQFRTGSPHALFDTPRWGGSHTQASLLKRGKKIMNDGSGEKLRNADGVIEEIDEREQGEAREKQEEEEKKRMREAHNLA